MGAPGKSLLKPGIPLKKAEKFTIMQLPGNNIETLDPAVPDASPLGFSLSKPTVTLFGLCQFKFVFPPLAIENSA